MNILLYTFTFLLIFASLTFRMFTTTETDVNVGIAYTSYFQMRNKLHQKMVEEKYKKLPLPTYKKSRKEKKKGTPHSAKRGDDYASGKLNLKLLFDNELRKSELAKAIISSFFQDQCSPDDLEYVLRVLQQKGRDLIKNNKEITLAELMKLDKKGRDIFYRLLKGSHKHNTPPLTDFVNLRDEGKFAFYRTPYHMMEKLMPPQLLTAIKDKEAELLANKEGKLKEAQFDQMLHETHIAPADIPFIKSLFIFTAPRQEEITTTVESKKIKLTRTTKVQGTTAASTKKTPAKDSPAQPEKLM